MIIGLIGQSVLSATGKGTGAEREQLADGSQQKSALRWIHKRRHHQENRRWDFWDKIWSLRLTELEATPVVTDAVKKKFIADQILDILNQTPQASSRDLQKLQERVVANPYMRPQKSRQKNFRGWFEGLSNVRASGLATVWALVEYKVALMDLERAATVLGVDDLLAKGDLTGLDAAVTFGVGYGHPVEAKAFRTAQAKLIDKRKLLNDAVNDFAPPVKAPSRVTAQAKGKITLTDLR